MKNTVITANGTTVSTHLFRFTARRQASRLTKMTGETHAACVNGRVDFIQTTATVPATHR